MNRYDSSSRSRRSIEQPHDLGLDADVERRHRFVEHQQRGRVGERTGDADPLALPARELVRVAVEVLAAELDEVEQLVDPRPHRRRIRAVDLERFGEQLAHREPRVQRRLGVLEHDLQVAARPPQGPVVEAEQIDVPEPDRARGRLDETEHATAGRRLPAPRLADERERLAVRDVEADRR